MSLLFLIVFIGNIGNIVNRMVWVVREWATLVITCVLWEWATGEGRAPQVVLKSQGVVELGADCADQVTKIL